MAFEGLFRKRRLDSSENQDESQQRQEESGAPVMNRGPQEPVLPDREALEREAEELFVSKEKQPEGAPVKATSPIEERTSYTGDAEIKQLSPQEAAMTKARTDVLDMLAKIEKAGLPVSPELRVAIKNELVNLASEAARIEFQEAERANPVLILNDIFTALAEETQLTRDISQKFATCVQNLQDGYSEFLKKFRFKQEEFIQKGRVDSSNKEIINDILSTFAGRTFPVISVRFLGFTSAVFTATEKLLTRLSVYQGGQSIPLDDLFNAIKNTGRIGPTENDLPYFRRVDNGIAGLQSTLPALKGLRVDVQKESGERGGILIYLRGDALFFRRVVENAQVLEKNS